jgi:hypothetical protein
MKSITCTRVKLRDKLKVKNALVMSVLRFYVVVIYKAPEDYYACPSLSTAHILVFKCLFFAILQCR